RRVSPGVVWAIAAAAIRIRLNVPIRLMPSTLRNVARLCGAPSRLTVRSAQPMPAQFTTVRSGAPLAVAAFTAAVTDASSDTSALTKAPPVSEATFSPRSSFRSAMTTALPAIASSRAAASPRPLAPPEMIAAVPLSSMAGAYWATCPPDLLGGQAAGPAGGGCRAAAPAGRGGAPEGLAAGSGCTGRVFVGPPVYHQNMRGAPQPGARGGRDAFKIYLERHPPSSGRPVTTGEPRRAEGRPGRNSEKVPQQPMG